MLIRKAGFIAALILLTLCTTSTWAQNDLSTTAITQPQSGCALSATEQVTLRLFNFGNTLPAATSFNIAYTINAGAPVVEWLTLGSSLLSNSALSYTFTTRANLSTPGVYFIDGIVALAGDINPNNDAFTQYQVQNTAPSIGGSVTGPGIPTAAGVLSLNGYIGAVIEWQQSIDGTRWRALQNTSSAQPFALLAEPTRFRALVQNGSCAAVYSSTALVHPTDPIFSNGFES